MASIRIRPTQDGTYTLYRNGDAVSSGLTREQADQLALILRCIAPGS
ncbi:hypothetical protein OPKNFCMD_5755 [Methylobacterium crusticola]|uniref:Uncharacterized protein n=1 Tax=Methylobacterium crusticola TaxID=1697972 RepID=A0ABQ4R8C6_9HYPH|nr:hypothetical protein [Methylobacterium crusticola]GJD52987.1 hypothetical protein OPKNFCMD_5755 [Methylobacterium crusticola]